MKNNLFFATLLHAALGGLLGIFFGLIFGMVIVGLGLVLTFGHETFMPIDMTPPLMFCMGVGSVVGAVLGGLAVLRQSK